MDSAYFNATIEESLNQLDSGERLNMLLHPSSEYIWEIKTETYTILYFEEAKEGALVENLGFSIVLGTFGCLCAVMGTTSLVLQLAERNRKRQNQKNEENT